jgi:hypothetical protein
MKILSNEQFASLKAASDNWSALLSKLTASMDEKEAKELSVETIVNLMEQSTSGKGDDAAEQLQATIDQLTGEKAQLTEQVESLTAEVARLGGLPGARSATAAPAADGKETEDILAFAAKNNDMASLIAKVEETGFFPQFAKKQ